MEKEKKKQLIRTATKRFEKHGIKKTTLDEIARDLRISKATLYHYFNSKEDLYHSTLIWESEQFLEELKIIFSTEGLITIDFLKKYFEFKESIDQKFALIYRVVLSKLKEEIFEEEEKFVNDLLKREEETLSNLLAAVSGSKKNLPESFPGFLVNQSWGYLLTNKIYSNSKPEMNIKRKEILFQIIESILI